MENEWQPAIIINFHQLTFASTFGWPGKRVRVRKIGAHYGTTTHPCGDKQNWFEVHWDDAKNIPPPTDHMLLCEHELLTD
jgi:hypothetical protein